MKQYRNTFSCIAMVSALLLSACGGTKADSASASAVSTQSSAVSGVQGSTSVDGSQQAAGSDASLAGDMTAGSDAGVLATGDASIPASTAPNAENTTKPATTAPATSAAQTTESAQVTQPEQATPAEQPAQTIPAEQPKDEPVVTTVYKDGTYTGSGQGYNGKISVSVTIKDDKITAISISANSEDQMYMDEAKSVINAIISAQSTQVDTVSGATYSSKGIIDAVASALKSAKN